MKNDPYILPFFSNLLQCAQGLRSAEPQHAPIPYLSLRLTRAPMTKRRLLMECGFRADVSTNELETDFKDAADAKYSSSAITREQAAVEYSVQEPAVQKARTVQAATPALVIRYAAPVLTTAKTIRTAPVIKPITHATPTIVKTVQAAPAFYAAAHARVASLKYGDQAAHDIHFHEVHHKTA
ncbi:hypothetical protein BIW11_03099 [Tropilaelaps mercedesae]|uniref:Uncharacterized protein n=1 Tax=Tropilaelaps mercedesae TaxID=418985 RepID=A0A1V9XS73_9ACAR|nr:hypothetical protein BIW11_03099 [Tropilaelaps mercedesae]